MILNGKPNSIDEAHAFASDAVMNLERPLALLSGRGAVVSLTVLRTEKDSRGDPSP